jgi:hypothetical protein
MWPLAKPGQRHQDGLVATTPASAQVHGRRLFKNFDLTSQSTSGPVLQTWDLAGPFQI